MDSETMLQCFDNPLKRRILATLFDNGPMTPKELLCRINGASQATLYRALSNMESDKAIIVVSEERKRAVIEKTYGVNDRYLHLWDTVVSENNAKAYSAIMGWSLHRLYAAFERYSDLEDIDIADDGSWVLSETVYLNAQDVKDIRREFCDIVRKYTTRRSEDQRRHMVAQVLTPPEEMKR